MNNVSCSFCNAAHYIASCSEFSAKPVAERHNFAVQKNLCFNCLGSHRLSDCRTIKRCRKCKGQHHTLLHRDSPSNHLESKSSSTSSAQPNTFTLPAAFSHLAAVSHERQQVLLATAAITLITDHGRTIKARALLDQGSEVSLIQESLVQLLQLPRSHASIPILSVGAQHSGSTRASVTLRFHSRFDTSSEFSVTAFILPKITGRIPSKPVTVTPWTHIVGLPLADPDFAVPGPINVLLGAAFTDPC